MKASISGDRSFDLYRRNYRTASKGFPSFSSLSSVDECPILGVGKETPNAMGFDDVT